MFHIPTSRRRVTLKRIYRMKMLTIEEVDAVHGGAGGYQGYDSGGGVDWGAPAVGSGRNSAQVYQAALDKYMAKHPGADPDLFYAQYYKL